MLGPQWLNRGRGFVLAAVGRPAGRTHQRAAVADCVIYFRLRFCGGPRSGTCFWVGGVGIKFVVAPANVTQPSGSGSMVRPLPDLKAAVTRPYRATMKCGTGTPE
jgi:hypothetical protein